MSSLCQKSSKESLNAQVLKLFEHGLATMNIIASVHSRSLPGKDRLGSTKDSERALFHLRNQIGIMKLQG